MVKRGEGIFSKFRGELAKRGELKNSGGGGGVWTLDEAMFSCPKKHSMTILV